MLNIELDEMGNAIVLPPKPGEVEDKKEGKKKKKGKGDYQLAQEAVQQWQKPLAFHGGEMWSFTPATGWEVKSNEFLSFCNQLRGKETSKSVYKIVACKLATPDLSNAQEVSTYWERIGGLWDGEWRALKVSSDEIVFSNGILNLTENKFYKLHSRIIFGPRVTIPYTGMNERCEEFENMVERALPPEEAEYFQKICSLILQPQTLLRGQIVLYGQKHSGKTTIATAISCAPAGMVGASFITEERLVKNQHSSTPLINKFSNVSNDSEFTPKWEAFMKSYTSGTMVVEPKFHKSVSLPVTAKIISTCNEMQRLKDNSGAAEQRFKVFAFTKPISETGKIEQTKYMQPSYWCDPARRAGIVGWMLRGLKKALKEGILEPESMKAKKKSAISNSDPLYLWVLLNLRRGAGFLSTKEILEHIPVDEMDTAITARILNPMIKRVWEVKSSRVKGVRGFKDLEFAE